MSINLYNRRKDIGLTLESVGKLVGVGKSTVRKWENGGIENMKRDKIVKYANALKISPMELIDPNHELSNQSTIDKTIDVMNQLSGKKQERVYGFALSQLDDDK
ncbi:XRE family transcriptional regulator [Apilactobacillus micheneri]|nr:XRE family transcriptional regulator [Apilactobacillus micheneri]